MDAQRRPDRRSSDRRRMGCSLLHPRQLSGSRYQPEGRLASGIREAARKWRMRVAHDVYTETNPAFCAFALVEFTKAYSSVRPDGPETPTAYLALPIALSGELSG